MIIIESVLPRTREAEGQLVVLGHDGKLMGPPVRCRGEADNTYAASHDNPEEDPREIGGDHPSGDYRITRVVRFESSHPKYPTYGPAFIGVEGVDGEAFVAHVTGRRGIGIHGGRLAGDGRLRVTYGCLRVDNETAARLADLVDQAGAAELAYRCRVEEQA